MLRLPAWLLHILLEQLPALEAEDMERQAVAATVPWLKPADRRRFFDRLASVSRPRPARPPVQILEHDPAKAAAYWRALGVDVVSNG